LWGEVKEKVSQFLLAPTSRVERKKREKKIPKKRKEKRLRRLPSFMIAHERGKKEHLGEGRGGKKYRLIENLIRPPAGDLEKRRGRRQKKGGC